MASACFGADSRHWSSSKAVPLNGRRKEQLAHGAKSFQGGTMATKIFVNLPVKNLSKSIEFFTKLGFRFNQQFTDETATCMIVTDDIFAMLLTEEKFKTFTPKPICDAKKYTEVLVALSYDSRPEVDEMVRKAVAAGGSTYNEPQDHGFMYAHGFQDLDGHIWEIFYMDPSFVKPY
jgi:predicted lactoylglutathione lyase